MALVNHQELLIATINKSKTDDWALLAIITRLIKFSKDHRSYTDCNNESIVAAHECGYNIGVDAAVKAMFRIIEEHVA